MCAAVCGVARCSPILLGYLIAFIEDPSEPAWKGYLYALFMFAAAFAQSVLNHQARQLQLPLKSLHPDQYTHRITVTGMRLRVATVTNVFRKALRLSNSARQQRTLGELINLVAVDAQAWRMYVLDGT